MSTITTSSLLRARIALLGLRSRSCQMLMLIISLTLILTLSGQSVHAAVYTWADQGIDWGNSSNWTTSTAPGGLDVAQFVNPSLYNYPPSITTAPLTVGGLWETGAAPLTIGGANVLTINGTVINNGSTITGIEMDSTAGALTINAPLALGAAQTWLNNSGSLLTVSNSVNKGGFGLTIAGSGNASFAGVISGGGGLTMGGNGLLTLASSSSYTGGTTISSGTIAITGVAVSGNPDPSVYALGPFGQTVTVNGALNLTNVQSSWGGMHQNFSGSGTINLITNGTSYDSQINGGTLTNFTGTINASGNGVEYIAYTGGTAATLNVTVGSGGNGSLNLEASNGYTWGTLTGNGVISGQGGGAPSLTVGYLNQNSTFSGVLNSTGSISLTKVGTGMLTLAGNNNTYTGGTTINGGILTVGNPSQQLPSGTITVAAGATMNFAPTSEGYRTLTGRNFTIAGSGSGGNGAIQVNVPTTAGAYADVGIFGLALAGNATVGTFGGANCSGGGQQDGIHFDEGSGGPLTLNGYTLTIVGDAKTSFYLCATNCITGTGAIVINSGNLATWDAQSWASGTITLNPGATLANLSGGAVAAPLVLNGGTLNSGNGIAIFSGSASLSGNVTFFNSFLGWGGTGTNLQGNISGTGGLINAAGTNILSGSNTYTGNTVVQGGSLTLANSAAMLNSTLTAGAISFSSSVSGHAFMIGGLSGAGNISLNDGTNAVALTVGNNNQSTTYSGQLSSNGSLTLTGTGTLTLTGNNNYSGGTTVSGGCLQIGNFGANEGTTVLPSGSITVASGGEINFMMTGEGGRAISSTASIAGAGPTGNGAIAVTCSSSGYADLQLGPVVLSGNATIGMYGQAGAVGEGGIHFGEISGTQLNLNGNTLTLIGGGSSNNSLEYSLWSGSSNYFTDSSAGQTGALNFGPGSYFAGANIHTLSWTGSLMLSGGTLADPGNGGWKLYNPIVVSGGTVSTLALGTADYDLYGNLTGSGTVQKAGASNSLSVHLLGNNSGFMGTYVDNSSSTNGTWLDSANAGSSGATWVLNDNSGNLTANVASGGTISLGALSGSAASASLSNSVSGTSVTFSIGALGTNSTFAGNIQNGSGTVALTKTGTGVLTLAGNNDNYSGGTIVNGGTLTCGNPSQQLPSGTVTIGPQGTINFVPANESYRGLWGRNFYISGSGASGLGAIAVTSNGTGTGANSTDVQLYSITLNGDATIGLWGNANSSSVDGIHFGEGGSGNLNLNGYTLTLAGTGTRGGLAILYNSNYVTGSGSIQINSGGNLAVWGYSQSSTSTIAMNPGSTFDLNGVPSPGVAANLAISGGTINAMGGTDILSGNVSLSGGVTLANSYYGSTGTGITLSGNISGTGGFTNAAGATTLSGSNTFTGNTVVQAGSLTLANSAALLNSTVAGSIAFNSSVAGHAFTIGGLSGGGNISLNDGTNPVALTVGNNNQSTTYTGILSNNGSLTLGGTGMLTLTTSDNYTGATNVSSGTLTLQDTLGFASAVNVGPNGTMNLVRSATGFNSRYAIAGSAITGSGVIDVNSPVSGINGGWVVMNGATALNFSGTININSGVLGTDNAGGVQGTTTVNVAQGGVMALHNANNGWTIGALNGAGDVTPAQGTSGDPTYTLTLGAGNQSGTFSGIIHGNNSTVATDGSLEAGTLNLVKTGTGVQILSGSNTYNGTTTVNGGTLDLQDTLTQASNVTVGGSGTLELVRSVTGFNGRNTRSYNVTGSGALVANGVAGGINGGWSCLSGAVNLTGPIDVLSGVFGTDNTSANWSSNTSPVYVASGAVFTNRGNSIQIGTLTGSGDVAAAYSSQTTQVLSIGADNGAGTFYGVIHGSNTGADGTIEAGVMNIAKVGSGLQVLAGANTYTGATTISNGTLQLGTGLSGQDGSIANTTGVANNSTLAFNLAGSQTVGYSISGRGALVKSGSGTLVISAANSYGGPTQIAAGTLMLSGSVAGFGGSGAGWTLNSGASVTGNVLTLATSTGQARSAFYDGKVPVAPFTASFNFQATDVNGLADGVTFLFQNASLTSVGGNNGTGISPESGVLLHLYTGNAGGAGTSYVSGGTTANTQLSTSPVSLTSQDKMLVTLSYNGTTLTETIKDTVTGGSSTNTYNVNMAADAGGSTAYVGFAGGSGGAGSDQMISNFSLVTGSSLLPTSTPLQLASGATVDLNGVSQQVGSLSDYAPGAGGNIINSATGTTATLTLSPTGGSTTFSGVISGAGTLGTIGLTVNGVGNTVLANNNTYAGPTAINGGTLTVNGSLPSTSSVTVGSAATLTGSAGSIGGSATLTGNGVINLSGGTIAGTLGVTGGIWNGTATVNGLVTSSSNVFTIPTGANLIANAGINLTGGTLTGLGTVSGGTTTLASGAFISPSNLLATSAGTMTFAAFGATGGGTINLALSNSPSSGNSLIQVNGSLALSGDTTLLANKISGALVTGDYPLFDYTGSLSTTNTATNIVIGSGILSTRQANSYIDYSQPGVVSLDVVGNPLSLTWVGDGVANAWTQDITTNNVWWDGTGGSNSANNYCANGDNVTFDGTAAAGNTSVALSGTLTPSSVTVTGTNNYTFNGPGHISGVTSLTVQGPGSLTLSASGNNYTGGTAIQGGSIILGASNALPTGGLGSSAGVVTFGAATSNGTLDLAGYNQTVTGLAIASGVTVPANETITSSTGSTTLYFSGGTNSSAFPGTIQDAAQTGGGTLGLRVSSGTLDLSGGVTTYGGATTLNGGALLVNNLPNSSAIAVNGGAFTAIGSTINSSAPVTVASGATATFAGSNLNLAAVSNAGSVNFTNTSGTVTLAGLSGSGPTTFAAGAVFPTLSAGMGLVTIAGPAAITTASGGTATVAGPATITTLNGALLTIGGAASIGTASSGTANLTGPTASIGTLTNAIVNLSNNAALSVSTGTPTTGMITGTGSLTVNGPLTYTSVATTNTYNGGTTINNGGILTASYPTQQIPSVTITVNNGGTITFTPTSESYRYLSGRNFIISGSGSGGNGALQVNVATSTTYADMQIYSVSLAGNATIGTFGATYSSGNNAGIHFGESVSGTVFNLNGYTLTFVGDANDTSTLYNTNIISGTGNIVVASGNLGVWFSQNWTGGTITLNSGAMIANDDGANTVAAPLVLNGGTLTTANNTLTLTGSTSLLGNVTLYNSFLGYGNGIGIALTGNISGNGGFTVAAGTHVLSGSDTYTGPTVINAGTLQIGNGTSGEALTSSSAITNNGTLIFNHTDAITINAPIGGTGTLTKTGSGVTTLGSANSYTGNTTISNGQIMLGNNLAAQNSTVSVNVNNGLAFAAGVNVPSIGGLGGYGNVALTDANSTAVTLSVGSNNANATYYGVLSGNGGLVKTGTGALTLSATGTYSGATAVNQGTLVLSPAVAGFGGSGSGWTVNSNANITSTPITSNVLTLTDNGGGEARSAFYNTKVPVGAFTASFLYMASVGKAADGVTFTLQNSSAGTSAIGGSGSSLGYAGITPSAAVQINIYTGAPGGIGTAFSTGGAVAAELSTTSSVNPGSGDPIQVTLSYDGFSNLVETLKDMTTLATYTHTYTGENLASIVSGTSAYIGFTGATGGAVSTQQISNFTFNYAAGNLLPANTALQVASGATVDLGGGNETVGSLAGAGTVTNNNSSFSPTLTFGADGTTQTFSGVLANGAGGNGVLSLLKTGTGMQTLSGTQSTFTGALTVNSGTLSVASLADSGPGSNGSGAIRLGYAGPATLQYTGTGVTTTRAINVAGTSAIDSSGTGPLVLNASPNAIAGTNQNVTLTGSGSGEVTTVVSLGSGALTKNGVGVWQLDTANSYTGGTTINAGTLLLNAANGATGTGGVMLNGGALASTAGPAVSVSGSVTVASNASLVPGNGAVGSLSIGGGGGLTLNNNSILDFTISGSNASLLNVVGGLSGSGTATVELSYANLASLTSSSYTLATFGNNVASSGVNFSGENVPSGYALTTVDNDLVLGLAGPPTWTYTTNSNWNNSSNWSQLPANAPGATAIVGASTASQVTISLDIPQTLGSLTFANSGGGGYALVDLTGTNSLTMSNSDSLSPALINVTSGTHSIAASMMIAGGNLAVSASNNGLLTISGNIADDSNGGLIPSNTRSLTLTSADGTGELVLSGTNTYAGGTFVESGTLVLANNDALAVGSSLTIGNASAFAGGPGSDGSLARVVLGSDGNSVAAAGTPSITPVPEPGTLVLVVASVVAGLATWRRRRNRGN